MQVDPLPPLPEPLEQPTTWHPFDVIVAVLVSLFLTIAAFLGQPDAAVSTPLSEERLAVERSR